MENGPLTRKHGDCHGFSIAILDYQRVSCVFTMDYKCGFLENQPFEFRFNWYCTHLASSKHGYTPQSSNLNGVNG